MSDEFAVHLGEGFAGRFAAVKGFECVQADGEILQRCERAGSAMLANAAVVFTIGGVPRQVQFVFNAPVSAVECEQTMFVGLS